MNKKAIEKLVESFDIQRTTNNLTGYFFFEIHADSISRPTCPPKRNPRSRGGLHGVIDSKHPIPKEKDTPL